MTKNLFLIAFLLCFAQLSFANKVDDLKTDADVQKFITSIDTNFINPQYAKDVTIPSTAHILNDDKCYSQAKSWGIKNWVKADFNNDGRTDLLAIVYWNQYINLIAIDKGNNTFQLIDIGYSSFINCELVNTIKIRNVQLLIFHGKKYNRNLNNNTDDGWVNVSDTLVYKYNNFVELNSRPSHYIIDSIKFYSGPCYGSCPTLEINTDCYGHATYNAGMFSEKTGLFNGLIKKGDIDKICALLNYIGIKNLQDNYSVPWTDSPTCSINVKFKDGTVKHISDYGEEGTFGLRAIYSLFFNLTRSQNWVAIK